MEKSEGNTLINTRWLITNEKNIYIRKIIYIARLNLEIYYLKKYIYNNLCIYKNIYMGEIYNKNELKL